MRVLVIRGDDGKFHAFHNRCTYIGLRRLDPVTRWASGVFAGRSVSYSYRIAKASQNMLTVSLAAELGPRGFIVCAVHPGRLKTQSGSSDADTEPDIAARRLAEWIECIDIRMNGR